MRVFTDRIFNSPYQMTKKQLLLLFFLLKISIYCYAQTSEKYFYPETITISYTDEISLPINTTFKRFLTMNPKVISVVCTKKSLAIKALTVGESTLLIWEDKRIQIQIKVIPPSKRISMQQNRLDQMIAEKNAVSFMTYFSYSNSALGTKIGDLSNTGDNYGAGLSIRAPFFKGTSLSLGFNVDIQANNDKFKLSSVTISDITWPKSQRYSIFLGNISDPANNASFTNFASVKGVIINPLRLRIHKKFNPVTVKLTYGEKEQRTGNFISRNIRDLPNQTTIGSSLTDSTKTTFFKTDIKYNGKKQLDSKNAFRKNWGATIFHDLDQSDNFFYDFNLNLKKKKEFINLGLSGESDQTSYAISYSKSIFDSLSATLSRNYIPSEMKIAGSDSILNENANNMLFLRYSPQLKLDNFSFNSLNLSFTNNETKRSSAKTETKNSYALNTGIQYFNYSLTFGYNITDSKKTINPIESNSFTLGLTKPFKWILPVRCSLRYSEVKRTRFDNIKSRFNSENFGYFISTKLFKKIGYSFNESFQKTSSTNSDKQTSKSTNHSFNYSCSYYKNLIRANYNYRYSKSKNDSIFTSDSISHSLRASFTSNINVNTKLRLNYLLEQEEKEDTQNNQVSSIIEATFSSRFHTFFGWKPKTEIEVLAFFDVNYNGKYDEEIDRPLKKADILVNGEVKGATNNVGALYLGRIKGFNKTVSIARETIPKGYIFSTPSKFSFNKLKSSKERCLFGLILNTEISGTIYNDLNGNTIFDRQDELLSNITVSLSTGKVITTDSNGRYFFSPVIEGEHEIRVDVMSLPIGFRSISKARKMITVEKGAIIQENFGFQAIRILKVKLFANNDRRANQISNIAITLNNTTKKAKRNREYKFSKVNYGTHILTIPLNDLPFKIKTAKPKPLNFHPDTDNKMEIPIFIDKDPGTKDIVIILEKLS